MTLRTLRLCSVVSVPAIAALVACGAGPIAWTPPTPAGSGSSTPVASTDGPTTSDLTRGGSPGAPAGSATKLPLPEAAHHDPATLDPALATAKAPDIFRARFTTSRGPFVIEVHRAWAPHGADRFYNLVKMGFFDDTRFFRVVEGFMVQFGISGDSSVSQRWSTANIEDDPVLHSNTRGAVTFAQTSAPNSRSTQVFVNYGDNARLDASRFAAFGQVVEGMVVVESLYKGYGEGRPQGSGPDQFRIQESGNRYLDDEFPQLDRILTTEVL